MHLNLLKLRLLVPLYATMLLPYNRHYNPMASQGSAASSEPYTLPPYGPSSHYEVPNSNSYEQVAIGN